MKKTIALLKRLLSWPRKASQHEIALFCAEKNAEALRGKLLTEQARLRDAYEKERESWEQIEALRKTNRELGELCEQHEQASKDFESMHEAWRMLAAAVPEITQTGDAKAAASLIINLLKGPAQ